MADKDTKRGRPAYWDRMRMIRESKLSTNQKMLMVWLTHYAGESGDAFPKQEQLAADMTLTERHVRRLLGDLSSIITRKKRGSDGRCVYTINWSELSKRSSGAKRHQGTVSETEQPDTGVRLDTTEQPDAHVRMPQEQPDTGVRSNRTFTTDQPDISGAPSLYEHKEEHKYNVKGGAAPGPPPTKPAEPILLGDTPEGVAEEWNQVDGICHVRLPLTAKRRKALAARLKDGDWREGWREAIGRVSQSAFCRGGNDRKWKATFEWFLRPDTVTKILEGQYDGGKGGGADHAGIRAWLAAEHRGDGVEIKPGPGLSKLLENHGDALCGGIFEQAATEGWNPSG